MRPVTVSQTGTGATGAVPLNHNVTPFQVGVGVVVGGNTLSIQGTYDDPATGDPQTWIDLTGLTGIAANSALAINVPVRAVRANVTAGVGTSVVTFMQAGPASA